MAWIVDGHNLIPKLPGLSLNMPDDEEHLIKLLIDYVTVVKKKIFVYFDNAPPGSKRMQRFGLVYAHFVSEGSSADVVIRAKLRKLGKEARNWTIVSSDREIQSEAKYAGANIISSDDFAQLILQTLKSSGLNTEISSEYYPNESEVKQWVEIFTKGKKRS